MEYVSESVGICWNPFENPSESVYNRARCPLFARRSIRLHLILKLFIPSPFLTQHIFFRRALDSEEHTFTSCLQRTNWCAGQNATKKTVFDSTAFKNVGFCVICLLESDCGIAAIPQHTSESWLRVNLGNFVSL